MDYNERRENVHKAWRFLREHNHGVPDDILDLMRDAALQDIQEEEDFGGWCAEAELRDPFEEGE